MIPDLSRLSPQQRGMAAERVRVAKDFDLPELAYFNSLPCRRHPTLEDGQKDGCRQCGVKFRRHQRVGIAWSFLKGDGLLADSVGTGKTAQAAGLLAIAKEAGELQGQRALVVVRPSALMQWKAELHRFLPKVGITAAVGTKRHRVERYLSPWDVMLIGFQMLHNDLDSLLHFNIRHLIVDDVDALRHNDTRTAYCIKRISRDCKRTFILTGTPLQKKLHELYSVLEPIGGREIFGPESAFRRRYVREEIVTIYTGKGRRTKVKKVVGYKNLDEFAQKIAPLVLRRTAKDIDDVDLPAIIPQNVFLDLHPAQKARYKELKDGVLRIQKAEGTKVKQAKAMAQFLYGAQICTGLAALGEDDRPGTSVKLDWLEEKLVDGDLSDEKVVIFMNFKNSIKAMQARLAKAGVGNVTIWGEVTDPKARFAAQERFWDDPECKVLMGTTSIEQSLNLQVARHLVNVDQIMNPARMEQLAGRVRRDGSVYQSVYVHNLLTNGTQEEGYLQALAREQALIDYVWQEKSVLQESLSPMALLDLIGKSSL